MTGLVKVVSMCLGNGCLLHCESLAPWKLGKSRRIILMALKICGALLQLQFCCLIKSENKEGGSVTLVFTRSIDHREAPAGPAP